MFHRLGLSALSLALSFTAVSACAGKKNTELMVAVQTDLRVPKDLDAVTVRVLSFGALQHEDTYVVGPSGLKLPATIGVVPQDDESLRPIDIEIVGHFRSRDVVIRKARLTFAKERVGLVRLPLRFSCYDKTNCNADQTCIAGKCEQIPVIVGESLPDYTADKVFGLGSPGEGEVGECWDGDSCLATALPIAPSATRCVYDRSGEAGRDPTKPLTVALVKPGSAVGYCSAGTCRVALDLDPVEGWDWADDTHTKIRLAPNVCDRVLEESWTVEATVSCATKLPTTPLCAPSADPGTPPSDSGPENGLDAAEDSGSAKDASADSAVAPDAAVADTTVMDTGPFDTSSPPKDTSSGPDTEPPDTEPLDTGFAIDTGEVDTGTCIPKRCADLGPVCGIQADGCGGTLDCGTCGSDAAPPPDTAVPDTMPSGG